ncbi:THO complex subunit 3 [Capsicum annuum]|nr:THO complex subunit 3 [Capsicum annuum]
MGETIGFKNLHSREFQGHKKKVHSVAWNCSGTKLASGSVDQTARICQIEPHGHGKVKDVELKGHTDSVDQLCWDPKHAELIATASGDKTVRLWDARNGKCSQQVELSGENINITYKPDGTHIAVGNRDDELTILDVRKFKPIHKRKFNYEVNEIAWNLGGDMFFLTTGNGTVEVLAYPSLQAINTLNAHTAGCYCIAIDPLGRYFAVGSADSLVSLWSIKDMLCIRTFTKLEWPVRTISFNHTGEYIASASEDLFIDIANVQTGRSVHQIPCRAPMNSVEWNPKHNLLAYAGDDKNKYSADEVGKQCEPDILPSSRIISSVESRGPEKMVSKFPVLMSLQHNQIEGNHHLSNSKNISM